MGRSKGRRANRRTRLDPLRGKGEKLEGPLKASDSDVLPIVSKLQSGDVSERAWAASAISSLLASDIGARELLIQSGVVQKLLERLSDDNPDVIMHSTGALRNIAASGDVDVCKDLYRRGILVALTPIMEKALESLVDESDGKVNTTFFSMLENALGLLSFLCESTDQIVNAVTRLRPLAVVNNIICSDNTQVRQLLYPAAIQFAFALTDDNAPAAQDLLKQPGLIDRLVTLYRDESFAKEMAESRVYIVGIALSCREIASGALKELEENALTLLSEAILAPGLVNWAKFACAQTKALPIPSAVLAGQVALEILARYFGAYMDEMDDGEEDEQDKMQQDGDNMDPEPIGLSLFTARVMPLINEIYVVFAEYAQLAEPRGEMKEFLTDLLEVALDCANNFCWDVSANKISRGDLASETLIDSIRILTLSVADAVVKGDSRDLQTLFGCVWAEVKILKLALHVDSGLVSKIMDMSRICDADTQVRCVGVLGDIAQMPGNIDANKSIGVYLITLLTRGVPNNEAALQASPVSLDVVLEATNAIFDVYGDKSYDYDAPVFRQLGFLARLEQLLPGLASRVASVDRKSRDLRSRGELTVENLRAFIEYKLDE